MSAAEVARLRRLTRAELEAEQGRRAPSCACASWELQHGCACDAQKDWTGPVAGRRGWAARAQLGRAEGPRDGASVEHALVGSAVEPERKRSLIAVPLALAVRPFEGAGLSSGGWVVGDVGGPGSARPERNRRFTECHGGRR